eukprot:10069781-Alexandrium_andersonii.AAC.1
MRSARAVLSNTLPCALKDTKGEGEVLKARPRAKRTRSLCDARHSEPCCRASSVQPLDGRAGRLL